MTWQKGKYRGGLIQAAHLAAGSAMYCFPWPRELDGLGAIHVVPFSPCGDCGRWGACAAYGDRPLCLKHARERAGWAA